MRDQCPTNATFGIDPRLVGATLSQSCPVSRIAIIGDGGGWTHRLDATIVSLGGDPDAGTLPEDVTVIQVGDLVDKGPDSKGAIALVDRMLIGSRGRWIQLLGNHEAGYVGGPTFWRDDIQEDSVADLHRWIGSGQVCLAAALDTTELNQVLVTHSGLARQKWEAIGSPDQAVDAAATLNAELLDDPDAAFRAGEMVEALGEDPVGVVWASPRELLSSWDGHVLPFSQVFGHASPFHWSRQTWDLRLPKRLTDRGTVDMSSRRVEFVWPGGGCLVCVDPSYGTKDAAVPVVPFELEGRVVG